MKYISEFRTRAEAHGLEVWYAASKTGQFGGVLTVARLRPDAPRRGRAIENRNRDEFAWERQCRLNGKGKISNRLADEILEEARNG